MTPEQIRLVQHSWQSLRPISDQAAELFYARLFDLDPSLRPMFKGDMLVQRTMLMSVLGMAVASLGRLHKLLPTVRALGQRHAGYGVKPEHYETVGSALLFTLETGLGDEFTDEVRDAWARVYALLADTMKEAATAQVA
jgi:hemoglobin-like flavoprotein